MSTRNPICSVLNRWIDETSRAEDAAGHNYYERKRAVRALGRIHYSIWLGDLHEKTIITLGDCLCLTFDYITEIMHDTLTAPFNITACKRR